VAHDDLDEEFTRQYREAPLEPCVAVDFERPERVEERDGAEWRCHAGARARGGRVEDRPRRMRREARLGGGERPREATFEEDRAETGRPVLEIVQVRLDGLALGAQHGAGAARQELEPALPAAVRTLPPAGARGPRPAVAREQLHREFPEDRCHRRLVGVDEARCTATVVPRPRWRTARTESRAGGSRSLFGAAGLG